ncbi:MAG: putative DNA binding protein [Halobacteriales archaeon]|jgi:predicted DNA binding protein
MSLIAEIHLHGDIILFAETFERASDAVCKFEDYHYVTDEDGETHYVFFWWVSGTDFTTFENALQADSTVSECGLVTELGDRRLYRVRTISFPDDQSLVFPTFREDDITAIESVRDVSGLHLEARFPDRDVLESFVGSAQDIARNVDVKRLYTDGGTPIENKILTQNQREVLSLALKNGYFDSPSRVTLDEIAAERAVTPQTLSTHIRKGVKKLVEHAVNENETVGDKGI